MAKVSNREDALFNAYLSKYKNAQASTVSEGQSKTQAARQKGAAILNATDKTLPSLGDTYGSTLQNIVSGAKMENSLSSDLLNRNLSLAKAQYDYASDMHTQMTAAKKYADEQAEKARKEAEEAAAKAQKEAERQAAAAAKAAARASRRSSRRRKGSSTGSAGSASGENAGAAMDALFGSTASTGGSTASSKPKAEDTKKDETKSEKPKGKSAQEKYLEAKKAGTRTTAAKSYAEQNGTGRGNAAQPAQSRAVTRGGKVIGSSYAAAGSAPSAAETRAAKDKRNDYKSRQEDTAAALKKLQTDAGYRAELAAPGRKLTSAEVAAVNQYEKSTKNTGFSGLKRVFEIAANKDGLSQEDYAKKTAAMNAELNQNSALRAKAQMNGAGQTAQAFTAGLYDSVPFLTKSVDKLADIANATGAEVPQLSNAIEGAKSYDPLAAAAGTLVGKGMQYKLFNTAMEGTPLAQTMGKAGNAVVGQAKKIPVLGDIFGAGVGDALGRILTDTTADLALDTLPTLADDLSTYRDQQQAIANGETVDEALTPGKIAGNTAKNIAGNVVMNALPEVGGAVISGIKNRRAADSMLEQQAKELDEWKRMTSGLYNADDYSAPDDTIDFTAAIQNSLDDTARQQRNAASVTRAERLNTALAEQAAEDKAAYAARQAAQNSGNLPIDSQGAAAYNGTNGGVGNADMGTGVRADVLRDAERGAGTEYEPGIAGTGLFGQDGTAGQSGAARGNGYGVQSDGTKDPAAVAEWAKSITGKDRKSSYTRRIENLYNQIQNGASRESLTDEATNIAMGIVKDGDFSEPLDEATTTLREYFKNTPIRLDEHAAGDILYSSGLKNIQQYNIQNGTNFSLTNGLPYDTAMMELSDMGAGVSGSTVNDLLQAVSDSNRKPIVDADLAAAHVDYYRDAILNGTDVRSTDFDTWLRGQTNDETTPDYIRNLMERPDFKEPPVDYDLLSLEDNYQQFEPTPQTDDSELNGMFLNENAPLTSDTGYSYAADHLQDAMNRNSSGSVAQDSPYYNDWMLNQGALRQQQAAGGLLTDDADAMEAAANRMDSMNRRSEELLGQDAVYRQQREKTAARQARLDAIQQEYEQAANQVPTLKSLAGSTTDWKTQPGLMMENGEGLDAYAAPAARQTAESVQTAAPQARPLNGSESVPANAVGAESTQYNRNEVLNRDYANQRVMRGDMDEPTAAELGIGEQTHTVYSRAEGRDTASQDFDVLVQQTGSVTVAGRTVADELNRKIQNGQWDASDVYAGSHAAEQLRQRLAELPEGSAEADVVKAQIANINRAVSAGQSKAGQALVSGRYAQPDEYSGIRRFEQYTQNSVDRFANTRQGQQLHDVAQEVADTMNGPMDDEFTAFVHSQGVDTGDDVRDQLEYMAEQIQRMGRARNVNINEEQARAAAARLQAGGTVEDIYGAFARQALGIGDLSQEDLDYAVDTFRRISDMPDSRERYDLEMSVYGRMANYMPARGFADRLNNIRYLCMLGNSRTHIRNMMGNVMMGTVTRAKDNIAGVMQLALPQNERTKAVGTMLTADGRRMVNRARDYADNQMYSILYQDGRWNMDTGLQAARNTYTTPVGRAIGRLSDINGGALEAEDNFFLRSAFGNSMASFLKARGYDSSIFDATDEHSRAVLRQAAAQALEDAREATFHEDNFLSTAFRNFSNDTRRHGLAGQIAYAVTEGILPFKKTPINIAKNALEYNPIGGAVEAIYRGATGQGATRAMDAAAKGVTGTAILGAGYLLAKNGMLTGGASGDDRADNYNEMLGGQNYAVKIPGKGTYTLDWASPSSVPLLIGAQIAKDQEAGGEFNLTQTLDRMRQITQPVLETTMLQGLNDTLDSVSYADSNDKLATLATSALGSFANQFVPTALGQVARTVDDTRRNSYGGGDTKTERDIGYNIRKMENKIPGLSKNNEPYIDQWGREEASLDETDDSAGGMFLRGAYNMLSPGYVSAENITPVDEYLKGLYGNTNDSHVLPEKASSQIKVDGEGYYMTPEEKTEYAKTSGQTAYDLIDELRQNSMFLQLPEDQQSALVQDAYTVAKTAGGVAAVGDGVSGVDTNEYEAYRDGGAEGFSQYVLMKNATDLVRDEKRETSGNDNADLNTVEKWNTLYSQFGDDAVSNFVDSTDKGSTVHNISDLAGDKAVTAYMRAYSSVANTLDDGQTPDKFTVGYGMQRYGLSGDDFARAYLAAYYKKDKNGKYPEKGGSYADKAGAEIYQSYGADALRDWVNYRATIPDTNGNGKVDKSEAVARLNEMDLTNELRRAYLTKTNKQWKNPY